MSEIPTDALVLEVEGLRYEASEPPRKDGKRVVVTVRWGEESGHTVPLRDRVDLYTFRSRYAFAGLVRDHFGQQRADVLGHLAVLLDQIERSQAQEPVPQHDLLTDARREAALTLLEAPDLLDRAAGALAQLGYVGEERTKRLCYLVATSRLLQRPLSAILTAASGCGKSELLDVVARLMPPEAVEFLSRISAAALYYAGPDHLRHKLILVDEQAGASEADYAIRTLQSKGLLRLAVPVKGKTEPFTVFGPISLMSGTTSTTLNPENLSRCLQIALDDSPEQTHRVQSAQRRAWAGERRQPLQVQVWQDAQRLLEPVPVVIPFAPRLTFPARTTADRRGNQKLLGLIAAHALLNQGRRERDHRDRVVALVRDYRAVHGLLGPVVQQDLDGLSTRAARLYRALAQAPAQVTRRDAAALLGWGYNTAKRALSELEAQELVCVTDLGPPRRYRLLDRTVLGAGHELLDPNRLED